MISTLKLSFIGGCCSLILMIVIVGCLPLITPREPDESEVVASIIDSTSLRFRMFSAAIDSPSTYKSEFFSVAPDSEDCLDAFHAAWYDVNLIEMKECALNKPSGDSIHIYRFLWLRSFHAPYLIKLDVSGEHEGGVVTVKMSEGFSMWDEYKLARSDTIKITPQDLQEFFNLIDAGGFWEMETHEQRFGIDGAQWVLEGRKGNEYHLVHRWSPEFGGFRDICLYLIKLGGLESEEIY